jgi:hypothetical protein
MKGKYTTMNNPYLYDKLLQNHRQELLQEAEQQRMLAQLPQHHPQLMQQVGRRFAAFFMSLQFSNKKMEQSTRTVTGHL